MLFPRVGFLTFDLRRQRAALGRILKRIKLDVNSKAKDAEGSSSLITQRVRDSGITNLEQLNA